MNEQLINTTTSGVQYQQTHILLEDGHLIAWVSNDHNAIYGQQFDTSFAKKGGELLLVQGEPSIASPRNPQLFNISTIIKTGRQIKSNIISLKANQHNK